LDEWETEVKSETREKKKRESIKVIVYKMEVGRGISRRENGIDNVT
jgi:hypothetical protein